MEIARKFLLAASTLGVAFFLFLLIALTSNPAQFEQRLKNFAVATVKAETVNYAKDRGITLPEDLGGSELQAKLAEKLGERSEIYEAALEARVDQLIANVLTSACSLDCEQRSKVRRIAGDMMKNTAERYDLSAASMREFALDRYESRVRGLHRDLIIVAATNLIVFLLIIVLTVRKPRFTPILVKIGSLAFLSALTLLYWYIFGQDWMTTLIFNAYVGWAYAGFMGALFMALCDVAFNKARILSLILKTPLSLSVGC